MYLKQLLMIVISCSLLACAGTDEVSEEGSSEGAGSRPDCIFRSSVRGYTVLDESNLIIEASGRRNYHMTLRRRAYGIRSSWGIAFDSPSSRICAGFSEVKFNDHFDGGSIRIASIRELNQEEYELLLIQFGKKEPEIKQAPAPREVNGAEVEELDPAAADDSSGN